MEPAMSHPPSWLPLAIEGLIFLSLFAVIGRFYRQTGVTPMVLTYGDDPAGLSGRLFRLLVAAAVAVAVIAALWPKPLAGHAGTIAVLDHAMVAWAGNALIAAGGALMTWAQLTMGMSWRIGIPAEQSTALIRHGIFRISRNPIYLGLMTAIAGLVLAVPNALTLAIGAAGLVGLSYQIRLEEQHLARAFGGEFERYRSTVRRWI